MKKSALNFLFRSTIDCSAFCIAFCTATSQFTFFDGCHWFLLVLDLLQITIFELNLKTFGRCKIVQIRHLNGYISCINQNKKNCFVKRNTIMLLYMYQVFSSLLGHLHFFLLFFFPFIEYFFIDHPISK